MNIRGIAAAVGPPVAAALIGTIASRRAPEVYGRLDKPAWAPPASVFGPAWTALYALIGTAGWRMWSRGTPRRTWLLHGVQLGLNAAWSPVFFTVRDKRAALAIVMALDATVAAQIIELAKRDRTAAALLAPYLAWSLFATALNASVSDPGKAG